MVFKALSRFRLIAIVTVLLSIPVVLLYLQRRSPGLHDAIASPIAHMSFLMQDGFSRVIGSLTDRFYALSAAFESNDELVTLRAQVDEAKGLKIALLEAHAENMRLKELMDFSSQFHLGRKIGTRVIGRTGAPLSRTIQIDRGLDAGIKRGDAVMSSFGAVGQILLSGPNYSEVLLLTDASSAVDVMIQRTRARGILKGVSGAQSYRLRVNDFDRLHEVSAGDIVITSGMGARFPAGVPVGEITSVKQLSDSLYVEADVKPFARFDTLDQVIVLADGGLEKPWRTDELIMEQIESSPSTFEIERR